MRETPSGNKRSVWFLHLLSNPFSMLVIQSICCFSAENGKNERESEEMRKVFCSWRWGWGRNCYQNEIDKLFAQRLCLFNMLSTSRTFSFYWNRPTRALDNGALHLLKTCLSSFLITIWALCASCQRMMKAGAASTQAKDFDW